MAPGRGVGGWSALGPIPSPDTHRFDFATSGHVPGRAEGGRRGHRGRSRDAPHGLRGDRGRQLLEAGAPFDITTIGAEFSVVLKSIQRAAEMLEAGETAEVAIQAEKMTTLIRVVNDYLLRRVLDAPDANIGKARYMLRTRVPTLCCKEPRT